MLKAVRRLFKRRPVIVQTYKVSKSDWIAKRDAMNARLRAELAAERWR